MNKIIDNRRQTKLGRGKSQSHRTLTDSILPVGPLPLSKKRRKTNKKSYMYVIVSIVLSSVVKT